MLSTERALPVGYRLGELTSLDQARLGLNSSESSGSPSSDDASAGVSPPLNSYTTTVPVPTKIYGKDQRHLRKSSIDGRQDSAMSVDGHCHSHNSGVPQANPPIEKLTVATSKLELDGKLLAEIANLSPLGSSADAAAAASASRWAPDLLTECARAVLSNAMPRIQRLMWILNELASPYGDAEQRLASYFLQGLFCKITGTGQRCHQILSAAAERSIHFDSQRKMILKFQEASPWTNFGHVAANGAILEALEGDMKVHIVDMSHTLCTQWPTLLESLATRPDGAPQLRLTTILLAKEASASKVMKEIGQRLEKFARLMGVPFQFKVVHQPELAKLRAEDLDLKADEALVVNCNHALHRVPSPGPRNSIVSTIASMNPKLVTLVEAEADLVSPTDFLTSFSEALRYYSLFFQSLDEGFPRACNERLMLERKCARNLVKLLACEEEDDDCEFERLEKGSQWSERFHGLGFTPVPLSDDVVDDVRALLKRYDYYKEGSWGLIVTPNQGLYLTWKHQPAMFTSIWKVDAPSSSS
ncbi:hypothetical protein Mapa_003874 [Marchantia paleacea]|nr:hypothetical protein Mapa_003874 [Marchantia paleacea]